MVIALSVFKENDLVHSECCFHCYWVWLWFRYLYGTLKVFLMLSRVAGWCAESWWCGAQGVKKNRSGFCSQMFSALEYISVLCCGRTFPHIGQNERLCYACNSGLCHSLLPHQEPSFMPSEGLLCSLVSWDKLNRLQDKTTEEQWAGQCGTKQLLL